jgi:hypothetical protein
MPAKQVVFFLMVFVLLFVWILRLIILNRLRETYAVMWVVVACGIPVSILLYPFVLRVSLFLGFAAPVHLYFTLGFIVFFVLSVHFSAMNSEMHRTLKNLVQKVALLEADNDRKVRTGAESPLASG